MPRLVVVWVCVVTGATVALADARRDCFEKGGDIAIRACTEAIERDPKDAVSHVNRAFEYVQKRDHARAIADYSKAIELDAGRSDAYQGRAWAYLKAGKAAQGLADAERSLQISPKDARALDTRGHIYEALGRREDAVADFRRALALEPRMQGSREGLQRLGVRP
ncbi:MAG: tetratricopeptide repeat protein [Hyphomonadaceae bacterium]|jgi:Tfp pilus assembly protein PilF|nr:tetratricopeptide repeat protein [Hyphomonadaceae bacterium]